MDAWVVHQPGPIDMGPLRRVSRSIPEPGANEVLVHPIKRRRIAPAYAETSFRPIPISAAICFCECPRLQPPAD